MHGPLDPQKRHLRATHATGKRRRVREPAASGGTLDAAGPSTREFCGFDNIRSRGGITAAETQLQ